MGGIGLFVALAAAVAVLADVGSAVGGAGVAERGAVKVAVALGAADGMAVEMAEWVGTGGVDVDELHAARNEARTINMSNRCIAKSITHQSRVVHTLDALPIQWTPHGSLGVSACASGRLKYNRCVMRTRIALFTMAVLLSVIGVWLARDALQERLFNLTGERDPLPQIRGLFQFLSS